MSTMTGFAPLSLQTRQPVTLGMQQLWLSGYVLAMGARLWVRHEFTSQESKPLEVIYSFALPRDAALRRFRMSGKDFHVDSELRPAKEASKIYEEGIAAGSFSTMARQYGDGLINLSVGNIRPQEKVVVLLELLAGVELHDDSLRFRFPFTVAPSYHRQARAIEIAPGRLEMELPGEEFDDLILPQFLKGAELHQVGFCLDVQMAGAIEEIASPSHAVRVQTNTAESSRVSLSREGDVPDRDLVLDVKCKPNRTSGFGGMDSAGKGRFAAVISSTEFGKLEASARRFVILLDRSGSMQGKPLTQAKKAIEACLGVLDTQDFFGLAVFSSGTSLFQPQLAEGNKDSRRNAQKFLERITAEGGTELAAGLEAAAKLLANEPGDILIITDGQVFGTEAILSRVRATGVRLHCLGIGSASQDRFLAHLASHTGGTSRFLTPNERVDLPVLDLFASIGRPVAQDVRVTVEGEDEGRISPEPSHYVFSGTPLLIFGETPSKETAQLKVTWKKPRDGAELALAVPMNSSALGNTLKLLQGSRLISDLESRVPPPSGPGAAARKEADRASERLLELSREYGLASSQMSLVAVARRTGDVAGGIPKTQVVSVGIPEELCMDMVVGAMPTSLMAVRRADASVVLSAKATGAFQIPADAASSLAAGVSSRLRKLLRGAPKPPLDEAPAEAPEAAVEDVLVKLAGMLEPDGGMAGKTPEIRAAKSLAALLCFASQGNTSHSGPFRMHVSKLLRFLRSDQLGQLGDSRKGDASQALDAIAKGKALTGDWFEGGKKLTEKDAIDDMDAFWRQLHEFVRSL